MVRSALPPHQAVFRFPTSVNKIDIQSLLTSLYGIQVTDIRTMNYLGRTYKKQEGRFKIVQKSGGEFKKVVVTMKEDFVFPPPVMAGKNGAISLPPRVSKHAPTRSYRHLLPLPEDTESTSEVQSKA
jgi:ribosomal protein L23